MKITTILFDFVGVLLESDPSTFVSQQVEKIDCQIGQVVDDRAFRETICNEYGLSETQFETVLEQVVSQYRPFEPLWQMLPVLRQRYRLGIINNGTWLTYPRFNARYGINRLFDGFISSAVEGVRKPGPDIYLRACQKLQVSPEHCIFLDDSQENVSGAIDIGMQGMWWETHQTGFQQLQAWLALKDGSSTGNGI